MKEHHTHPCTDCPFKEEQPSLCKACAYEQDKKQKQAKKITIIIEVEL